MKKERQPEAAKNDFAAPQASPYQVREYGDYIVAHQGSCHGQPTFKGTRVMVHLVLESLKRAWANDRDSGRGLRVAARGRS